MRFLTTLVELAHSCEAADDLVASAEKADKYGKDKDGHKITPGYVGALLEDMKEAVATIVMEIRTVRAQAPRKEPEEKEKA